MAQPESIAATLPWWSAAPFAGLLVSIAVLPLAARHWWESNFNKGIVAAAFGLPVGLYFLFADAPTLSHAALEYSAFICLLGALYVISGGIHIRGGIAGTPLQNTLTLAVGAVLANLVGTTGASMLLIRPYLKANEERHERAHLVVFFIFIVSNAGGCLTPMGDPPLFLGFLRGVPFTWTLNLWPQWLFMNGALLILFNLYDQYRFNREAVAHRERMVVDVQPRRRIEVIGAENFLLLFLVVVVVFLGGTVVLPRFGDEASKLFQIAGTVLLSAISLVFTGKRARYENRFSWYPIVEVAVLFAGIFASMLPALLMLEAHGAQLNLSKPWQYFWTTGLLSGVLDNAPTYLTFWSLAQYLPDQVAGTTHDVLAAISCGAVFMGANTYIGNGPNFMVRSIAEHHDVRMPSFIGFMLWAGVVLTPLYVAATLLFFVR